MKFSFVVPFYNVENYIEQCIRSLFIHDIPLEDDFWFDDEGYIVPEGVSLCNPKVVEAILCNYSLCK